MRLVTWRFGLAPHLVLTAAVLGWGLCVGHPLQGNEKPAKATPVLEFRIVANDEDDHQAIQAAKAYFEDDQHRDEVARRAKEGLPPPPVSRKGNATYTWVEVGRSERLVLNVNNEAED